MSQAHEAAGDAVGLDPHVVEKAMTMKEKNEYIRDTFPDMPKTEVVVQNYRGSYHRSLEEAGTSGKLWVTANFLLFCTNELYNRSMVPLEQIRTLTRRKAFLIFNSVIEIELVDGTSRLLSGLFHRDELYYLLEYLRHYTPLYFKCKSPEALQEGTFQVRAAPASSRAEQADEEDLLDGRWGSARDSIRVGAAEQYDKVEVGVSEECVGIVEEVAHMGLEVRGRMEDQARSIDRMDRSLLEADDNVKKGQRQMRGVESIGGQVVNLVQSPFQRKLGAYEAPDRDSGSQDSENYYDVPILAKHPNDSLQPSVLRFGDTHFVAVDCEDPALPQLRTYKYNYPDVCSVVLRARPYHLDIRFHGEQPRFRCMSSYVQMIANELFLRTRDARSSSSKGCDVVFEPGVRVFGYGDPLLRTYALESALDEAHFDAGEKALFRARRFQKTTEEVVTKADPKTRSDLDKVDENLAKIQERMSQVYKTTEDIHDEGVRQVEQLRGINKKADKVLLEEHKAAHRAHQLV